MTPEALVTLAAGIVAGYFAQKAALCSVAGFRDLFILRSTYMIKGVLGIGVGVLTGLFLLVTIGGKVPNFPLPLNISLGPLLTSSSIIPAAAAALGGLGVGLYSVISNGCPIRQHIRAGEGNIDAIVFMLGYYLGILYFYSVIANYLSILTGI